MKMRIKELRIESKMSQKDFAKRVFVSPTVVCNWENGTALPRTQALPLIANVLGCTIDDLYCITPDGAKEVS